MQRFKVSACTTPDASEQIEVNYRFLPYTIEGYTASTKDGHTLEIKNDSNFSDDLTFAWYFTNKQTGVIAKYMYDTSNAISHTFTESGTYAVRAYTRQMADDVRRSTEIMTVTYDAATDQLNIDWSADCTTVK